MKSKKSRFIFYYKILYLLLKFLVFFSQTLLWSNVEIENLKEPTTPWNFYFHDLYEEKVSHEVKGFFRFRFMCDDDSDLNDLESLYFYQKLSLFYNNLSFGYMFLHRKEEVIKEDTIKYFLRKWFIKKENFLSLNRVILGNYRINFGYGMVFSKYAYISEFVSFLKPQKFEIEEDLTSSDNANFYGVVFEDKIKNLNYFLFFSQKNLIIQATDYFISNADLLYERNSYVEYSEQFFKDSYLNFTGETILGGGVLFSNEKLKIGLAGYYALYNKIFDPDKSETSGYLLENKYSDKWEYVYRGDRLFCGSFYGEVVLNKLLFFLEMGKSFNYFSYNKNLLSQGNAINSGFVLPFRNYKFYLLTTYLEPTFYSPCGVPLRVYKYPNNQWGFLIGNSFNFKNLNMEASVSICEILKSMWSGYFSCELPRHPCWFQNAYVKLQYIFRNISFEFRSYNTIEEKYISSYKYEIFNVTGNIQTKFSNANNFFQLQYKLFEDFSFKFKYIQNNENLLQYNKSNFIEIFSLDFSYKKKNFVFALYYNLPTLHGKMLFSNFEQIWKDVYFLKTYPAEVSEIVSVVVCYNFDKFSLWSKFANSYYFEKRSDWSFSFQFDFKL
ncbi:MAG: hypothetical protein ABDH23_06950 [Endomicrobiia bacterium]